MHPPSIATDNPITLARCFIKVLSQFIDGTDRDPTLQQHCLVYNGPLLCARSPPTFR